MEDNSNRLYRSESDKMVTGLCGGIAEVYNFDPSVVRVITILLIIFTFPLGLIAYFVAALIVPTESELEGGQSTLDEVGVETEDEEDSEDTEEE